ncbi:uncharacterized protein DUF2630 [Mucilaginibacter gracilis]|uniref:Uncharacterized protein DUF2630 n=1 Tax=Mucilaginibacter gracilis TaxID=423350 RepID=A0A495IYT5_9SPHI|nr:DUF2630 family protein [Mucilaginibacter gracilis]RKR81870.1 uncharacterized protein DUF2630 [Mucilaginibacter gracilis]
MEDLQILKHLKNLTDREEKLWVKENLTDEEVAQLHQIKLELDQHWDLLRQRRALRDAGENPDKAEIRDIDTIENYKN